MSERTITIPYEEYQELKSVRNVMSSNGDIVYVRDDTFIDYNHYVVSSVHTKDDYVKRLTYKLNEYKKKEKEYESALEGAESKVHSRWKAAAIFLGSVLVTNILLKLFA